MIMSQDGHLYDPKSPFLFDNSEPYQDLKVVASDNWKKSLGTKWVDNFGGGGGCGGGVAEAVEINLPSQKKLLSYSVKNRRWEEQTAVDSPTVDLLASLLNNASSTASSEKVCIHTISPLI